MSKGLSDKAQAILTVVSAVIISVGATSIPAGAPWPVGLAIALAGSVGFGIKEALGIKR